MPFGILFGFFFWLFRASDKGFFFFFFFSSFPARWVSLFALLSELYRIKSDRQYILESPCPSYVLLNWQIPATSSGRLADSCKENGHEKVRLGLAAAEACGGAIGRSLRTG